MVKAEATIVVVDDDARVRELLRDRLELESYRVLEAADGATLLALLAAHDVDLVTLDIGLDGESGLSLMSDIRRSGDVAVIMVTGRDDLVDTVVGLELGADDYVGKPFEPRELIARIRSVLRRYRRERSARGAAGERTGDRRGPVIAFGSWRLYPRARVLVGTDGEPCELSSTEFDLLRLFVDNAHEALSRDAIMDALKGRDWNPTDRTVDNLVLQLRKKIEGSGHPPLIRTVRGVGYRFEGDVTHR